MKIESLKLDRVNGQNILCAIFNCRICFPFLQAIMVNGKILDQLEGCLEFLEFGRYGRALNPALDDGFHFKNNTVFPYPEDSTFLGQRFPSKATSHQRTGRKSRDQFCNCEYEVISNKNYKSINSLLKRGQF